MFLGRKEWEEHEAGWYYDTENRTAKIKYEPPRDDYELNVWFAVKDLISI
jgi:alpha-glucosidase